MTALAPTLPVDYRDAEPGQLRVSFALRRREPICSSTLRLGRAEVELAILSASHQVLVTVDGRLVAAEAVACDREGDPLPATAARSEAACTIDFSSRTRTLPDAAFAATLGRLNALLERDPNAVVTLFPGHDLATTGLRAWSCCADLTWRTWHAYPRTRQLVTTCSQLRWRGRG